jgi:adenosylcobinamide-GDP ribazoletransferase
MTSLRDIRRDLKVAMAFCTRLPVGANEALTGTDVARAFWAMPVAGIIVGALAALAYVIAHWVGVPPLPAAALSLAATMVATGCLHEDGLADTADGLGGTTREETLAIMHDSRIGTFGTCALVLSLLIRAGAIASLATPGLVAAALIAANAAARACLPIALSLLPPARADGLSAEASRVSGETAAVAAAIGVLSVFFAAGLTSTIIIAVLLLLAIGAFAQYCRRALGGHTGDALGALEQVGEIIVLLSIVARP